jgi:transcriptional regulator with XRE-family HTH domain
VRSTARFVAGVARSGVLKRNFSSFGNALTALAAEAGLSQHMISYMDPGTRHPALGTLLRISQALEIPLGKLITEAEQKGRSIGAGWHKFY